jgi:predicted dehydrogenase
MTKPIAALIGTGRISGFHVQALRAADFDLRHVAASPNSSTVDGFALEHGISQAWKSPIELAGSDKWDVLVIAARIEATADLLRIAASSRKPILVEKPISYDLSDFDAVSLRRENVFVGYNRRYYAPVQRAKEFVDSRGPSLVVVELPQSLKLEDQGYNFLPFISNAIHGIDLCAYLFGGVTIENINVLDQRSKGAAILAMARTKNSHMVQFLINFNAPSNFSITIDNDSERFQLRPFEIGCYYKGIDIIEPDEKYPARRYMPKLINQTTVYDTKSTTKPGFLEQCLTLKRFLNGGERDNIAATMQDARNSLELINLLRNSFGTTSFK